MTVSSTTTRNSYTGDGSTTVFAYTFKIFDDDDITVILRTTATGTETVQTKTTHYSVSGVGSAGGGNITFVTAPTAAQTVVLLRQTAQTQTTDYTPNDPFPAASHEDALDKMTLIIQDQQDELDRAIKLSRTNTMTSTEFTVGASDRASKVLAFDTSGELSVTQELGTFRGDWSASTAFAERDLIKDTTNNNIYLANTAHTSSGSLPISTNTDSSKWDLIVDAAAATTSATNAATSATAAAASATAAAASEAAAATSETNAAASEAGVAADAAAAAASASSASTSATNAATSETNAATSASAASTSASNAATSATSASNSATSASTSASNAATSATNASNSASAASTSASNAATSETNAATSESNAATSASSAASDASAAATSAAAAAASFDAFDDIYLGAKASAPTVDNDGDALTAGDQYFNTTNSTLYVWNGSAWQSASPDIVADITPQLGGNLDTNGNDINFGDNDKAVFGAGSDLQIYHDGSSSRVVNATGNLKLQADILELLNESGTEQYLNATYNGAVNLYHNNAPKLATTSSGIDVTGTVTADGLTVDTNADTSFGANNDGATTVNFKTNRSSANATMTNIASQWNGTTVAQVRFEAGSDTTNKDDGRISFRTSESGGSVKLRQLIENNGDISFYDSTGVTQGLFWDANEVRLGLGTTSPARNLHLYAENSDASVRFQNTANSKVWEINPSIPGVANSGISIVNVTDNTVPLHIDNSGNVGIGSGSPTHALTVQYDDQTTTAKFHNANTSGTAIDSANVTIESASRDSGLKIIANSSRASFIDFGDEVSATRGRVLYDHSDDSLQIQTAASEAARITSDGLMGIGTSAPATVLHLNDTTDPIIRLQRGGGVYSQVQSDGAGSLYLSADAANTTASSRMQFNVDGSEAARISGGSFLVGTSNEAPASNNVAGVALKNGSSHFSADGGEALRVNRKTSDGQLISLRKDASEIGSIGTTSSRLFVGDRTAGLRFVGDLGWITPWDAGTNSISDDVINLGATNARFDDIYATNGTIQTSDANEKQDIEALSDAEQRVAVAAKGLLRKYRWKSSVEEKGDDARIHFGIIAQDLQAAFEAEGLDAGRYAMFINSEWTDEETGEQKSRMGIRYNQLLAFIIAAI